MVSVGAELMGDAVDPEQKGERSPPSAWSMLRRLEKTAIGAHRADGVTTVRRGEPAGCLLYGPYWQLPSGGYRLNFHCRSGAPVHPGQPVLGVEIIAMNRVQLAWLDLTARELRAETGSLDFIVPRELGSDAGDEARLEFRFFHLGNADLAIDAVDLHKLEDEQQLRVLPRLWRMLGRLEKQSIGRRTAEGVVIRQKERAGCVLDAGRPLLQLPGGHYRLTLAGVPGIPLMTSQPVLGIEVVARRRWQDGHSRGWGSFLGRPAAGGLPQAWRDFTAGQLSSGPVSIDFVVPTELSLEGGRDVVFALRLVHLGNADLRITAADLRQVAAEEAMTGPSSEWRLLGRLAKGSVGSRSADCVWVRRAEPPGFLLCGGRPWLHLPAGRRYRLSVCCRAGPPRNAAQPALAVEVVARRRIVRPRFAEWQAALRRVPVLARREFTSGTLQNDAVGVEFDTPVQTGRDGEPDQFFEFRILHLGNADLSINSVDLREAPIDEARGESGGAAASRSPGVVARKTRVIVIGNCQAQTVYEALTRTRAFNERVDAIYHFVSLQHNLHELARTELKRCDILFVQDIREWEAYPLRSEIPEDRPIVKFPLLHFASLWPFDHYNGPGDREAYERESPNLTFLYLDGLLARLRKEIPDREQRLLAYRSLAIDGVINYVRLHEFEARRLAAMDKQFGCKIGHFILSHFQKRRIFYTTNHPNGEILSMLLQHLLKYLGFHDGYRPIASLDHLRRLQVPVHPKVAKALGVRWANENTKYLYHGEEITWETYVRRYIEHYG